MADAPLIVALTGSIGSGKSLAGSFLGLHGVTVLDADRIAREVVAPDQPALAEIRARFGDAVFDPATKGLDRKKLAALVFAAPERRKELEQILHPKIRAAFLAKIDELKRTPRRPPWIVAYLVPLLFESGYSYDEIDLTVTVSAPREACLERVMSRDGCSREEAERRMAAQMPIEEKEAKSDIILRNTGSPDDLAKQVDGLYLELSMAAMKKAGLNPS